MAFKTNFKFALVLATMFFGLSPIATLNPWNFNLADNLVSLCFQDWVMKLYYCLTEPPSAPDHMDYTKSVITERIIPK